MTSTIISTIKNEFANEIQMIHSRVKGLRASTTLHGLSMDVLKSALQKYARRGEFKKGIRCLLDAESYAFAFDPSAGTTSANTAIKAIRTNIMNRLVIIALEDCMDPSILQAVYEVSRKWNDSRNTDTGMTEIVWLYKLLCKAGKGRYISVVKLYINAASKTPEFRQKYNLDYTHVADPLAVFQSLLQIGDIRCVQYLKDIQPGDAWSCAKNACSSYESALSAINVLHKLDKSFNNKHAEHSYILYHAMFLALHPERVRPSGDVGKPMSADRLIEVYRKHLSSISDIQIDDYVLDMHTKKGAGGLARDAMHFALEGAKIENVNADLVTPDEIKKYNDMYVEDKQTQVQLGRAAKNAKGPLKQTVIAGDDKQKTEDKPTKKGKIPQTKEKEILYFGGKPMLEFALKDLPVLDLSTLTGLQPLQEKTCGNKPMTYSATTSDGKTVVVKHLNTGLDAIIVDSCKSLFGLTSMNARGYKSLLDIDKVTHAITKGTKWKVYMVADLISDSQGPATMLGRVPKKGGLYTNRLLLKDYIKIAAFRGLFRVTDFCPRNVLYVSASRMLVSIDENNAGKCLKVIQRKDAALTRAVKKNIGILDEVYNEISSKIQDIVNVLSAYQNKYWSLEVVMSMINKNLETLTSDIERDLGI